MGLMALISQCPPGGAWSGKRSAIQSPWPQPQVAPLCLLSCLSLPTAPQMLPQHRALPLDSSPNQFSLYTSPSLPNISLGLQATVTVTNSHLTVSAGHIPCPPSGVDIFGPGCPQLGLLSSQGPHGAQMALLGAWWWGRGRRVGEGRWSKAGRTRGGINPSLISISPPHPQASPKLSTQQEAERQALQSLRQGGALTGKFMSTSSIPGCLLGVALEGDTSPHGHASLLQHVLLLEQARQQSTLIAGEWAAGCARRGCGAPPSGGLKVGPAFREK